MANKPKDNNRKNVNMYMDDKDLVLACQLFSEKTGVEISRGRLVEILCKKYLEENQPVEKTTTT